MLTENKALSYLREYIIYVEKQLKSPEEEKDIIISNFQTTQHKSNWMTNKIE